jgi:predicted DNA-binding protein YlxM (UPF0122 family)
MVEDVVRKGRLLDVYGALLTVKQRRCMEMYYLMDLSLAEIGEEMNISRQGVYDMLHRASKTLEDYDAKLQLLTRNESLQRVLGKAAGLLDKGDAASITKAKHLLQDLDI